MSITVVTLEHGSSTYEADDWDVVKGRLWIGTEDVGVAEFNAGSWSYVFETVEERPRVWQSLEDIPAEVLFSDKDDDAHWFEIGDTRSAWSWLQSYAPFTEVVVG